MIEEQALIKYLAEGSHCPFCGFEQIEGESVTIDGNKAYQDCYCLKCGSEWEDKYQLVDVIEKDATR